MRQPCSLMPCSTKIASVSGFTNNMALVRLLARPMKPYKPDQVYMPHLMFDGLGRTDCLERDSLRAVVRAILERKYAGYLPVDYIQMVVNPIAQNPVRLREFSFVLPSEVQTYLPACARDKIAIVVPERHFTHHVHEQGYVEAPVRIRSMLKEIKSSGFFELVQPSVFPEKHITSVHGIDFVNFLQRTCREIEESRYV
jgi:hypothetical protein